MSYIGLPHNLFAWYKLTGVNSIWSQTSDVNGDVIFSENIDLRPCGADISQGCPPARVLHGSRQVLTAIGINYIITGSLVWKPEPCFNMKTISRYRQSHYKDKTVSRLSYLYNGNSYPGKWCNVAFIEPMHRRKTILLSILVRQSLCWNSSLEWMPLQEKSFNFIVKLIFFPPLNYFINEYIFTSWADCVICVMW